MSDIIQGLVTRIIDGDTFDMQVTAVGENNTYCYNDIERIRIANINAPELDTPEGLAAKRKLKRVLENRTVRCTVQARGPYGRVVVDVTDVW